MLGNESGKKRRLEDLEECEVESGAEEMKNEPMPYTCICFEGKFYTTDGEGYFIHNDTSKHVGDQIKRVPLYRCEVDPQRNVVFTFIRHLSESELLHLENTGDINAIENLSKHNKSLFY